MYVHHIVVIHPSVDGHLGCVHVFAIVNSAAMHMWVHASFSMKDLSQYTPRVVTAGSYGGSIFSFLGCLHTVFHSVVPIYIPTSSVGGSPFSASSPRVLFVDLLMMAIPTGVKVPQCGFDLHLSNSW